jgi:hypothetical protein
MPRPEALDRQFMMYFPSKADRERWRKIAKKSKMTFTSWIYEMVEGRLAEESEPVREISDQRTSLQSENHQLRNDLEKNEARLRELETQIFKLQQAVFLHDQPGQENYSKKLIQVLRSGGTWPGRDLLAELNVNPDDGTAIQIVTNQLQSLQDFGLVKESARGWRWIG